jgi:predicted MPP superfamily phosphohydrolase
MSDVQRDKRQRAAKFRRARIRNFLFTLGPNRLSGGRISRRHLAQEIVIREIEVSSPRWPSAFDGLRIGHVSDFHLGELLPLERALAVVDQLARQEPDLVACTGDVVDLHHHQAGPLLEAMAKIGAPLGSALVLGNHDELHCPETVSRLAVNAGMILLRNESLEINRNGHRLTIAGIDWAKSAVGCAKYIDQTCGDYVDLLLAHNPKAFMRASELEVPLTLSGHTHGGQIAMKGRPNANLAFAHRHRIGLFESGPSRLYVTSGVGAWFPLRVNCPAEIAMITMKHVPETTETGAASTTSAATGQRGKLSRRD